MRARKQALARVPVARGKCMAPYPFWRRTGEWRVRREQRRRERQIGQIRHNRCADRGPNWWTDDPRTFAPVSACIPAAERMSSWIVYNDEPSRRFVIRDRRRHGIATYNDEPWRRVTIRESRAVLVCRSASGPSAAQGRPLDRPRGRTKDTAQHLPRRRARAPGVRRQPDRREGQVGTPASSPAAAPRARHPATSSWSIMEARSLWPGFFSAVRHVSLTAELRTPLRHSPTDGARSAIEGFFHSA
jgi:hypothetical protein